MNSKGQVVGGLVMISLILAIIGAITWIAIATTNQRQQDTYDHPAEINYETENVKPIPEPISFLMLGTGGLLLMLNKKRNK